MNTATAYVYLHVVNYEPTYLARLQAVRLFVEGHDGIALGRDLLADSVTEHLTAMGLDDDDLSDSVDFAAIVAEEAGV